MATALAGFVFGIAFGSVLDFGFALAGLCAVLSVAVFLALGRDARFLPIAIFFLFFGLGLARVEIEQYRYVNELGSIENSRVTIESTVLEYPDTRAGNVRLVLLPNKINSFSGEFSSNERILVKAPLYPKLHYGDKIILSGTLKPIKNFSDSEQKESGREFDYEEYMARKGIFREISSSEVKVISSGNGNILFSSLFKIREKFSGSLRENISEPEVSLSLGMTLGEKHGLPEDLTDTFTRAGIVHMVVLSGYNIALVSQFFMKIFSFLPVVYRALAGGLSIVLFIIMTGGGASAVRAGVMALIALLGTATGRTYDAGRALFLAGVLMLIENPNILLFDASFQLSFLATLGLIYLTPPIFLKLGKWRPVALKELISQTISTQIAVLPLLIYLSGMVSLVSLPVNILVLPASPLQMFGTFLTGLLGFLGQAIALPFAFITSLLLSHTIWVAELFAGLPFATISVGKAGLFIIICVYAVALFIFWKRKIAA